MTYEDFYRRIGYRFQDEELLRLAFTHPSYKPGKGGDYQRLEFLGDAVLEYTISDILYREEPDAGEGILTRARAYLVCEDALSQAAEQLGLGPFIRLGFGEAREGGAHKHSILCDVYESVLAAIYLDGGLEPAKAYVRGSLYPLLRNMDMNRVKDPKSRLQEKLQKDGKVPLYVLLAAEGPAHAPRFTYAVEVDGARLGTGTGSSKQEAQQQAAKQALDTPEKERNVPEQKE